MKKLLLILSLFISSFLFAVTPGKVVRVALDTDQLGENMSAGNIIINTGTGKAYSVVLSLASTKTIATCTTSEITEMTNYTGTEANTIAGFDASSNLTTLSTSTYPTLGQLSYVKGARSNLQDQIDSFSNPVITPQTLTGTTPTWAMSAGINAIITLEGNTTITMSGLIAGERGGNLTVINATPAYTLTFAGYVFDVTQSIWKTGYEVTTSGLGKKDKFSYYYDGLTVTITGNLGLKP